MLLAKNKEYLRLLNDIKARVRSAQIKAAIFITTEKVQQLVRQLPWGHKGIIIGTY